VLEIDRVRNLPYDDFLGWVKFFEQRPTGWREDQRAYAIMSSFGTKAPAEDVFMSLRQMKVAREEAVEFKDGMTVLDSTSIGGFLGRLSGAVGGENLHAH
jgi:hypothetical protein